MLVDSLIDLSKIICSTNYYTREVFIKLHTFAQLIIILHRYMYMHQTGESQYCDFCCPLCCNNRIVDLISLSCLRSSLVSKRTHVKHDVLDNCNSYHKCSCINAVESCAPSPNLCKELGIAQKIENHCHVLVHGGCFTAICQSPCFLVSIN